MMNADLIKLCYEMRENEVDQIKRMSKGAKDDFSELSHYIGRLGATRSAAHSVVKGMISVPALRITSNTIRLVEAPGTLKVVIKPDHLKPYELVRRICEDPASRNPLENTRALHRIVDLDLPSDTDNLRVRLQSQSKIITRVHAELQIADTFSRHSYAFVDNDKYIGCSKPACYFCFGWLRNHEHGYVSPATHQKIILGCRGYDSNINESGAVVLKKMYAKLCTVVGQDILESLLKPMPGDRQYKDQHQSTEGSSYAPRMATMSMLN
jgi:hypothetical protein